MRLMRQMPMQWALRLGVCVVVNVVSHLVHVCGKCVVQKSILFRGCILRFFLTRHDAKWSRHVCYDIHMTLCERLQPSITLFDFFSSPRSTLNWLRLSARNERRQNECAKVQRVWVEIFPFSFSHKLNFFSTTAFPPLRAAIFSGFGHGKNAAEWKWKKIVELCLVAIEWEQRKVHRISTETWESAAMKKTKF